MYFAFPHRRAAITFQTFPCVFFEKNLPSLPRIVIILWAHCGFFFFLRHDSTISLGNELHFSVYFSIIIYVNCSGFIKYFARIFQSGVNKTLQRRISTGYRILSSFPNKVWSIIISGFADPLIIKKKLKFPNSRSSVPLKKKYS